MEKKIGRYIARMATAKVVREVIYGWPVEWQVAAVVLVLLLAATIFWISHECPKTKARKAVNGKLPARKKRIKKLTKKQRKKGKRKKG